MSKAEPQLSGINTREIVLDFLVQLEKEQEYSHKLMKDVLDKYAYLPMQERAFIKRLSEGSIERRIELDYVIDSFSKVKVKKMKPLIRSLMRMSVYQILFMDSVPDSAACNEAVKLAVKRKFFNLKGFVNGVLRQIVREKENLSYPNPKTNPVEYISVTYSMPQWIVEKWILDYGMEKTERILKSMLEIKPVTFRVKEGTSKKERQEWVQKVEQSGVHLKQHPFSEMCYLAENIDQIPKIPGFEEGFFTIQDVSSVLAVEAAGIHAGDKVLDICAAPGGKSIYAAQKTGPSGQVIARDVSEQKVDKIKEAASRMQMEHLTMQVWDARQTDETLKDSMDVVIADVPCSGLGVMGKKRDIKYRINEQELEAVAKLQKEILAASVLYVKPGGTLLYSTCTIHKEENEKTVEWICKNYPFECESLVEYMPSNLKAETLEKGYVQLLPDLGYCDGFFFSRLKRKKDEQQDG